MVIKRNKFNELYALSSKPEVLIILGARQVGKTTLMGELQKEILKNKPKAKIKYFNLEVPTDLKFFSKNDVELFEELSVFENGLILIDEFHYLKNASKLFKALYDIKKNIKIIASGSSSLEIHKHLKESLAGRRNLVQIFPLVWNEFKATNNSLEEFLIYGGLPGLISLSKSKEKIEYLSQMTQAYILKDIKGLIKEENIRAFNHLLFYLAENQGSILNISNVSNEIGVGAKTVNHYLEIMEQTFVLYGVFSYTKNLSNELKKSKKYYFYDQGIRNSLLKNFAKTSEREDIGIIAETFILLELKSKQLPNVDIRFWRTKEGIEIDFLWIENRIPIPIEVKTNAHNDRVPASFLRFFKAYPKTPYGLIFCRDREEDIEVSGKKILYRKWEQISDFFNS